MNREQAIDVLKAVNGVDTLDDPVVDQIFVDGAGAPAQTVSKDKMLEYAYGYALHQEKALARQKAEA